jgi:hypothetical protein
VVLKTNSNTLLPSREYRMFQSYQQYLLSHETKKLLDHGPPFFAPEDHDCAALSLSTSWASASGLTISLSANSVWKFCCFTNQAFTSFHCWPESLKRIYNVAIRSNPTSRFKGGCQ